MFDALVNLLTDIYVHANTATDYNITDGYHSIRNIGNIGVQYKLQIQTPFLRISITYASSSQYFCMLRKNKKTYFKSYIRVLK